MKIVTSEWYTDKWDDFFLPSKSFFYKWCWRQTKGGGSSRIRYALRICRTLNNALFGVVTSCNRVEMNRRFRRTRNEGGSKFFQLSVHFCESTRCFFSVNSNYLYLPSWKLQILPFLTCLLICNQQNYICELSSNDNVWTVRVGSMKSCGTLVVFTSSGR